jgi:hypothetical protein
VNLRSIYVGFVMEIFKLGNLGHAVCRVE